jgi:flagellar biosynthetic protein FliO
MKVFILIFTLSVVPVAAQTTMDVTRKSMPDSSFLSNAKKTSYSDSLRSSLPATQIDAGSYMYKVVFVIFVMLVFLIGSLYLYNKFVLKTDITVNTAIKVVARQSLSPKQSIVIVNIQNKKFALGVTEHQVNLISELGEADENEPVDIQNLKPGFAQILKKVTGKG